MLTQAPVLVNAVIADPGGGVFISDPKKPAGGHVLAHAATIRLMFRKGKGEQRVCKVFDAPNLPESEAISFSCYISVSISSYCDYNVQRQEETLPYISVIAASLLSSESRLV